MARTEFIVTQRIGKWFVDAGPDTHGPYLSERDATADAIEAAEQTASSSRPIVVLRKAGKGPPEEVWSSSKRARKAAAERAE